MMARPIRSASAITPATSPSGRMRRRGRRSLPSTNTARASLPLPAVMKLVSRPVQHTHIGLVEIEHRDVGALARLQRADLVLESQRLGGVDGRHLDRALDRHAGRIEMAHMLHQAADLHLLDHVDRIVDHRAVGAERDIDARALRVGERRYPAAADRLAGRRVDEAAPTRAMCSMSSSVQWMPWIRIQCGSRMPSCIR